jgi:hypothetical protein
MFRIGRQINAISYKIEKGMGGCEDECCTELAQNRVEILTLILALLKLQILPRKR